jgi:hypothetical protein
VPHLDVLEQLRRFRARLSQAPRTPAPLMIQSIAHLIEQHPVLGGRVEAVLAVHPSLLLQQVEWPSDPVALGELAAAHLVRAARRVRRGGPEQGTVPNLEGPWGAVWRTGPGWCDEADSGRAQLVAVFIDPILDWAEVVLGALPGFSETVRRWAVRVGAFGLDSTVSAEAAMDERACQRDLARFLFDQGFDLGDLGREQVLRDRKGQGARVDFLLRDGHRVVVELVLVRVGSAINRIAEHATQLCHYCRDAPSKHGMLVVVHADPERELRILPDAATSPAGVDLGGVSLLVQVADV